MCDWCIGYIWPILKGVVVSRQGVTLTLQETVRAKVTGANSEASSPD